MNNGAIGVFDSGVGGLSVLRHVRALLPRERLVYVADSAHMPYGAKASDFIERRATAISNFLIGKGAKTIVVACNTATAAAVGALRTTFRVPIIGMEPGVKPAAAMSQSGVVGVLGTPGTLASQKFAALIQHHGGSAHVEVQACPGLVEQIERGDLDGVRTRELVQRYVAPLMQKRADVLVLGCTHYPFVEKLIREAAGHAVKLVETGAAVAREVKRRLVVERLLASEASTGSEEFWTSGDPDSVAAVMEKLWAEKITVQRLPASAL